MKMAELSVGDVVKYRPPKNPDYGRARVRRAWWMEWMPAEVIALGPGSVEVAVDLNYHRRMSPMGELRQDVERPKVQRYVTSPGHVYPWTPQDAKAAVAAGRARQREWSEHWKAQRQAHKLRRQVETACRKVGVDPKGIQGPYQRRDGSYTIEVPVELLRAHGVIPK